MITFYALGNYRLRILSHCLYSDKELLREICTSVTLDHSLLELKKK